jgi:hypothetical protein
MEEEMIQYVNHCKSTRRIHKTPFKKILVDAQQMKKHAMHRPHLSSASSILSAVTPPQHSLQAQSAATASSRCTQSSRAASSTHAQSATTSSTAEQLDLCMS